MLYGIAPDFSDRTVYVCGPDSFMQGVKTMFQSLDFPMQNYHEESFGPPKQDKSTLRIESLEEELSGASQNGASTSSQSQVSVTFANSGKEVSCNGKRSILELAETENIKIRHSCRLGVCGACKKRKLEGEVKYNLEPEALEQSDRDEGYVLTCVAHPVGRVVVEA
jgi:ferredoxin